MCNPAIIPAVASIFSSGAAAGAGITATQAVVAGVSLVAGGVQAYGQIRAGQDEIENQESDPNEIAGVGAMITKVLLANQIVNLA